MKNRKHSGRHHTKRHAALVSLGVCRDAFQPAFLRIFTAIILALTVAGKVLVTSHVFYESGVNDGAAESQKKCLSPACVLVDGLFVICSLFASFCLLLFAFLPEKSFLYWLVVHGNSFNRRIVQFYVLQQRRRIHPQATYFGVVLLLVGCVGNVWTASFLGKSWTPLIFEPNIGSHVNYGPYETFSHPMYAFSALVALGITFIGQNRILGATWLLLVFVILLRIPIENHLLAQSNKSSASALDL